MFRENKAYSKLEEKKVSIQPKEQPSIAPSVEENLIPEEIPEEIPVEEFNGATLDSLTDIKESEDILEPISSFESETTPSEPVLTTTIPNSTAEKTANNCIMSCSIM